MAGPSIVVRVLGDLKGLSSSMDDAGAKAQSTASKAHQAFSGMVSALNASGVLGPFSNVLNGLDQAIGAIAEHGKEIGPMMTGAGAGLAAAGAALSAFGSKEQAAHQQLQAAIKATGKSYDDYGTQIEAAIKHNENYGQSSEATQQALQTLTQATHDPTIALKLLGETTDLAAAKHEDLNSAASAVGKVYNGNTKLLKLFGIEVNKTTKLTADHMTATQKLAQVLSGQASASVNTFGGKLDVMKTKLMDQVSVFGQRYGPALQAAGMALMVLGSIFTIFAGMEWAALWPVLAIIAAIVALVAIGYVIYANWGVIWKTIKSWIEDVWQFIQTWWPLLLPALLGPFGLLLDFIIWAFPTIKAIVVDTISFLIKWFETLVSVVTTTASIIWSVLTSIWDGIYKAASFAIGAVIDTIHGIIDAVQAVADFVQRIASDIWAPIKTALSGVMRGVATVWNDTIGAFHIEIPSWVPVIGGDSFSMPKMSVPSLQAGGIITQTGFVYAHAGEAISPIPAGGMGPAVVIQDAHFSDAVDVDLFMDRVAWATRTKRL